MPRDEVVRMIVNLRDRRAVRHRSGSGSDPGSLVSRKTRSDLARERRNVLRQTCFSRGARIRLGCALDVKCHTETIVIRESTY